MERVDSRNLSQRVRAWCKRIQGRAENHSTASRLNDKESRPGRNLPVIMKEYSMSESINPASRERRLIRVVPREMFSSL